MATANRDTVPSLPALEPGITRSETDERATGALASLVLDHAMVDGSPVRWVDSNGHARTGRLAFEVGETTPFDEAFYRERLFRAAETVLSPLGGDGPRSGRTVTTARP